MNTIVEVIAIAIAEEYPDQREAAPELAANLHATAEASGIPTAALITWIRDRPRHNLSGFDLRKWGERYHIAWRKMNCTCDSDPLGRCVVHNKHE